MVKVRFYEDFGNSGRYVTVQVDGGEWQVVRWDALPSNIQTLLAAMSTGHEVNTGSIPWLKAWQEGR